MSDLIFNELLFYTAYHLHRSSTENIKKSIASFYSEEEILQAKNKLWEACGTSLGKFQDRHNSSSRSAASQHIADILSSLKKLDESSEMPKFAALQYERIPKMEPEDCNIAYMAQRITKMESVMQSFETLLTELRVGLSQVEEDGKKRFIDHLKYTFHRKMLAYIKDIHEM